MKNIKFSTPVLKLKSKRSQWNVAISNIAKELTSNIDNEKSSVDIFFALSDAEKQCSSLNNRVLNEISHGEKLSTLSNSLEQLNAVNTVIKNINLTTAKHIHAVIRTGKKESKNPLWKMVDEISDKIETSIEPIKGIIKEETSAETNIKSICQQSANLILSTMLKEMRTSKGQELIEQIHSGLKDNKKIFVMPHITSTEPGMAVSAVDLEGPFATIAQGKTSNSSIESRVDNGVTASKGSSSSLGVPIHVPESIMLDENTSNYLSNPQVVDNSLSQLMSGSLSFNTGVVSYVPFQVELLHELIHAYHNANGKNFRHVPLTSEESSQWQTYEEYVTIKGGDICEADFVKPYGTRPREDHGGQHANILFTKEGRERNSDPKTTIRDIIEHYSGKSFPDSSSSKFGKFKKTLSNIKNNGTEISDNDNTKAPR